MQIVRTYRNPEVENLYLVTVYRTMLNEYYVAFTGHSISLIGGDRDYKEYKQELCTYNWQPETEYFVDPIGQNHIK